MSEEAPSAAAPYRCVARIELDGPQVNWLDQLPMGAHEIRPRPYCELQGGHQGPHAALGQQSGDIDWWVRWTLSASEIVDLQRCPAETPERDQFDDAEPADICLLYLDHPGLHTYELARERP